MGGESVNYIAEIKAFYDWLAGNPMPSSAIALWHGLMSIANGAGWPSKISPSNSTLQSKCGMSKDAIINARNLLEQKKRINWKKRDGNQSAIYSIIFFASEIPTQIPPQNPTQYPAQQPPQNPPQNPAIYKLNETKLNYGGGSGAREESDNFSLPDYQVADLRKIGAAYENDIGAIPSSAITEFQEYYLTHKISAGVIVKAIQAAAENNVRTWPYIKTILERCVKGKIMTLDDWAQAELRKKSRNSRVVQKSTSYDISEIEEMLNRGEL